MPWNPKKLSNDLKNKPITKWSNVKLERDRHVLSDNMDLIKEELLKPFDIDYVRGTSKQLNEKQVDMLLAHIIEESGGDPYAKKGRHVGLLQWTPDRYRIQNESDPQAELLNQIKYLKESIFNNSDSKTWLKGSSKITGKKAYDIFHDPESSLNDLNNVLTSNMIRLNNPEFHIKRRIETVKSFHDNQVTPEEIRNKVNLINNLGIDSLGIFPLLEIPYSREYSIKQAKINKTYQSMTPEQVEWIIKTYGKNSNTKRR